MERGWLKAWIIATLVVASLAIAYESFLRAHRYVPTVQDDADLWSIQYDRVRADPHAVVLLGASRIGFAIDPKLMSKLLGGRTVAMLAINGNYPLATLRALAEDRNFAGLVVVGIDGGRVVFFREPVAGEHLALDEAHYPREGYWDAYARIAPMVLLDFRDEPAFAGFVLPDTSHIDGADVPRFTEALVEALARRGLVSRGASPPASPPPM